MDIVHVVEILEQNGKVSFTSTSELSQILLPALLKSVRSLIQKSCPKCLSVGLPHDQEMCWRVTQVVDC